MDARRALPFLLLVICAISAASIIRNGRGGPNNIRRIRRINLSEYLVPPPLPRFHPSGRIPRLVAPQSTEAPGYFARLMNWLNPFGSGSTLSPPPLPHAETSYPLSAFVPPPAPAEVYGGPSPATYDKPPPPTSSLNNHPGYPTSKAKNCNPCNKVPWMPIQHGDFSHSGDASFAPPPPPPPPQFASSSLNGGEYLPPRNREVPYDVHHAASQEIRAPDFSFAASSLPTGGQDGSFISPLPNPHLYPGAMPPLFKAEDFNHPVQAGPDSISEYLDAPPPPPPPSSSVFGDVVSAGNGSFPTTAEVSFNGGSVYPVLSNSDRGVINQEIKYINPDANNGKFEHFNAQNYGAHGDLSPSGTQLASHGHSDLIISDEQRFENIATQSSLVDSISHETSFGNSGVLIDQNPPSDYGISGLDQIPGNLEHQYNDLSSSANVAEDFRAPSRVTDESSAKIEDSIHFEESLLLDFTHKDESRTDSSSLPPTSNAFADSANTEIAKTMTLTPDDQTFGTHHDITTTESYFSTDRFQTTNFVTPSKESKINDSETQDSDKGLHNHKPLRGDISYIPPSDQVGYLWSSVLSTTSRNTESGGELWNTLNSVLNSYDDVAEETLDQSFHIKSKDANKTSTKQDAKRNKQVQLIIPYTSQYTPLPFHSSHEQNQERKTLHFASESNHDKYLSEESRNSIKVTSLPNSSYTWPTTSALLENITRKSVGNKVNNSIDVHKLQKNIDNWTIQEYSKGTTASTVSPSVNPYLFPSKQIPDEYLTTTEPVNQAVSSHDDNVKTFTLAGFSFNDLDYKGSASNRVEESQLIENSKSTKSSTDASIASTKNDVTWQGFSVDISPVDKERVYVVTPQPIVTTPKSNPADKKKQKATKDADRNSKILEKDIKKIKKKSNTFESDKFESDKFESDKFESNKFESDKFESIEKAYQVLPQAVNNLAVASTGPESVPLWGIMEHEEFASLDENEHENEDSESLEIPVLYAGHSKVSRARR